MTFTARSKLLFQRLPLPELDLKFHRLGAAVVWQSTKHGQSDFVAWLMIADFLRQDFEVGQRFAVEFLNNVALLDAGDSRGAVSRDAVDDGRTHRVGTGRAPHSQQGAATIIN